jgi:hypothetical protein
MRPKVCACNVCVAANVSLPTGAMYAFPRIRLSAKAVARAGMCACDAM